MAQKTTVAVRFTQDMAEVRKIAVVNEFSRLFVARLKARRSPEAGEAFMRQWFRIGGEENVFAINIWGEHETWEIREVITQLATEIEQKSLPITLDIVHT